MDWYRAYSEAAYDLKIRRLARSMGTTVAETLGLWHIILGVANESPERGALLIGANLPATNADLEATSGIADVAPWLKAFCDLGMICLDNSVWRVTNWPKRQFSSDDSAERVKKHRTKLKPESSNGAVTLHTVTGDRYSNGSVTPPEADTESDTEAEKESAGADAPPAADSSAQPSASKKEDPPDDTLLVNLSPGGLILLAQYDQLASSKGKKSRLKRYASHHQRKAFEKVFSKLNGELAPLIDKGFAHNRVSVDGLLSWLEGCVKRNESAGGRAAVSRPAQPTREQDHAAIDEVFRRKNGGK